MQTAVTEPPTLSRSRSAASGPDGISLDKKYGHFA